MTPLFAQATQTDLASEAGSLWNQILAFVTERGFAFSMNILAAIVLFIVGRWVAKILRAFSVKLMARADVDETLSKFLANIVYGLLLTFVVVAAVDRLGVNTTSLAAVIAAAGLAIGLALQSSLANFASGVMLILFKPFEVGDFVEAGGSKGVVEEIHIFSTIMRTGDNIQMIVPNGQITGGTITNFTAKKTRRIDLVIGCGYGDDLKAVRDFLESLIAADERILKDPEPVVAVNELADSSVNFVVRPWVGAADYWAVRWDLTEKIKLGFDEKGFSIPYPQQDVHVHGITA
ncbi:MAG: mechanosensitive ion channel [Planctomycetes bacterium]|nr:mechanosensitive ion channel [Planctomycetota bacterium]